MSEPQFAWLLAGFALVIAELLIGTFYLLVVGIAAFAGAAAAWLGWGFGPQVLSAALFAVAGLFFIHHHRKRAAPAAMAGLDLGQPVRLDSWINLPARHARVRYRDTLWDAFVEADGEALPAGVGDMFYIVSMQGNTLSVARRPRP